MTLLPQMIVPPGGVPDDAVYLADIARRVQGLEALRTKIGAGSINAGVLAAGTITGSLIQAGTITSSLIAAGAINAGHIQAGVIDSSHIAANTITAGDIAASTITSNEIAAATIQAADIAAHTITANEIAASTITTNELAANTITAADIAAGTITGDRIAGGTITGSLIASTTITGSNLVSATITADKLSVSNLAAVSADMGTLTAGKVQVGTAGGAKVAIGSAISTSAGNKDGVVGTDSGNAITFWMDSATGNLQLKGTILSGSSGLGNISGTINGGTNIAPTTITGDRMVVDTITATQIAASAITASELAALAVSAGHIQAGAITTVKLDAGAVTSDKINVAQLDAISADIGAVSAGTITGVLIQTATSGQRVVLDAAGLTAYGSDGITASVILPTAGDALFRGSVDAEGGITFNVPTTSPPSGSTKATWLDTAESEVASVFGITNTYPGSSNQALVASATGPLSYSTLVKTHANLKHYWKLNGATSPTADSVPTGQKTLTAYTTSAAPPASAAGLIAGTDQAIQSNAQGQGWFYGAPAAAENVTTGWSVEYWVKMTSRPVGDVRLVMRSTANDTSGTEYWKSTYKGASQKLEVSLRIGGVARTQLTASVLPLNVPVHIVHTYDGANIQTYANGAANGAATAQTGSIDAQGTANYVTGIIQGLESATTNAGTATDGGDGGPVPTSWTNLTNITSSNNAYVSAVVDSPPDPSGSSYSATLFTSNYGLAIPAGATIRGIKVAIERKDAGTPGANTLDVEVGLTDAGFTKYASTPSNTYWATTEGVVTYGGATDLWGATWTPTIVNSANFGFYLKAWAQGATTLQVDTVQITVYYSTSITVDEVAVYNAALSTTVISDHYQTGLTGVSTSAATYQRKVIKSDGTSDFMDNALVSVLPTLPYDGQVVAYQNSAMATLGIVWLLRYRAASAAARKWEFVGGAPMYSEITTFQSVTNTAFVDLATVGPSITWPLIGDYLVEVHAHTHTTNAAGGFMRIALKAGAAAAFEIAYFGTNSSAQWVNIGRGGYIYAGAVAGELLKMQYKTDTAIQSDWERRMLRITPIRVG